MIGKRVAKKKKARKLTKRPVGRPRKKYTLRQLKQIDELALAGHKTGTIAVAVGLDEETLKDNLSGRMAQKRVEGKIRLKQAQISKAIFAKDSTMLIWLGKNDLGQTDKHEISGQGGGPIQYSMTVTKTYKEDNAS